MIAKGIGSWVRDSVGLAFLTTWKKVRFWTLPTERARVSCEAYR